MAVDSEVLWFLALGAWAITIVFAIKPFHGYLMNKGCENMVAVYYNRKVAHMLAGGVPLILVPIVFTNPILATSWRGIRCDCFSLDSYF